MTKYIDIINSRWILFLSLCLFFFETSYLFKCVKVHCGKSITEKLVDQLLVGNWEWSFNIFTIGNQNVFLDLQFKPESW
jgi:hypothetical protein